MESLTQLTRACIWPICMPNATGFASAPCASSPVECSDWKAVEQEARSGEQEQTRGGNGFTCCAALITLACAAGFDQARWVVVRGEDFVVPAGAIYPCKSSVDGGCRGFREWGPFTALPRASGIRPAVYGGQRNGRTPVAPAPFMGLLAGWLKPARREAP